MAKLEIPVHVYMDDLEEIISELKHLQTYKLFEGDEMVLIDCDEAVKIFANHLRAEVHNTQVIEPEQQSFITFDDITLYKCDPAKNTSCKKSGCYVNGGPCKLTRHEEYREE